MRAGAGVREIVVRLFPDGSAWVRIGEGAEEGRDLALTAAQVGPVELGEAGRIAGRGRGARFLRGSP